jgi:predicted Zn-dependent protease with MMP-like domain
VIDVDAETFGNLVDQAIDTIPEQLRKQMRNVAIAVEDLGPSMNLLGLYHGVPLTKRVRSAPFQLPDQITIYRLPILRICNTYDEVAKQVRTTVLHEVAHYFGISDDRLHEIDRY